MWNLFKTRRPSPVKQAAPASPNGQKLKLSGWQVQDGHLIQQYGFFGGANEEMWWQLRCIVDRDDYVFIHVIASVQFVKNDTWLIGSIRDEAALMQSPLCTVLATPMSGGGTIMNFADKVAVQHYLSTLKVARSLDLLLLDKQSEVARIYLPNDPYEFQSSFAQYRASLGL
ncbi:hypothetical protein PY365_28690 [Roseiarcaceae bacterium H3SJ34-1]|uniref:hypothetical protein n=1 Tax=Terripilifer ovatus TaxID=3032367 RepID=UPI003AB9723B|nr:hypothetical protein [Roseiarcaceae bacterium H3SJ34-1]